MHLTRVCATVMALLGASVLSGCGGGSPTAPVPVEVNEVFVGTVAAPVDGLLQRSYHTFVVGQDSGFVTITLTSAVLTFPDGNRLPQVLMGLGIGTPGGGICNLFTGGFVTALPGTVAQISGSVPSPGPYCVEVSDVTNQGGPVDYAVAVSHY